MLIATKGDYGVRAMIDLARLNTGNPIARSAIATRRQIPEAYLDQLLGLLRRAGFINSVRGPGGGHSLAVDPKDITLFDLLETLEGSLSPMANLDKDDASAANDATGQRWVWQGIYDDMKVRLSSISLHDLAEAEQRAEETTAPRYLI